jgi:Ca2+-binding RTX toxin-like protein
MVTKNGTPKPDKLVGTSLKDKLFGLGGNDKINGLDGNDILEGGRGNDKLTGGDGADTFVFGEKSGKDMITDFDVNKDVISIAKGLNGIKSAEDVLDHAKQKGKHVEIDLGDGNKITLKFTKLADLKDNPEDHFDVS